MVGPECVERGLSRGTQGLTLAHQRQPYDEGPKKTMDKAFEINMIVLQTTSFGGIKTMAKAKKAAAKKTTAKKTTAKKTTTKKASTGAKRKPNAAFMKPLLPSAALALVIGAAAIPRTQVVKKLWAYIHTNKLQDTKNRRNINADAKLKPIFGKNQVSMFEMTKLVNKHLA